MPSRIVVALQMEFTGLMWAILGALGYIADCIRPGDTPKILALICFIVAIIYFIGAFRRNKNVRPKTDAG